MNWHQNWTFKNDENVPEGEAIGALSYVVPVDGAYVPAETMVAKTPKK